MSGHHNGRREGKRGIGRSLSDADKVSADVVDADPFLSLQGVRGPLL